LHLSFARIIRGFVYSYCRIAPIITASRRTWTDSSSSGGYG
jgi:hypothetical protein